MLCACLAWLSMQACTIENMADSADGGLKKEDLQGLEKSSIFLFILHSPNPIAAPLFAPCSTQRLYLHEHADFEGIGDVSPHKVHPALLHALLTAKRRSGSTQDISRLKQCTIKQHCSMLF